MNLSRTVTFAASMALTFLGSPVSVTAGYSHPPFSITEGSGLNLQETGSQLLIDTIEDVLYQGGLALFDDGFRMDSSLSWVSEESTDVAIEGEIDLVLPLYNEGGHVIFTQPGIVFWKGHGEEKRADGNFGIVYRSNLANTLVGIDAVGGASIFYDWDFDRVGHKRFGIGADIQTDNFHGAFNYYHPLSDKKDGQREDFIEKVLKGMDIRFALERDTIRAGASLGYWRYTGGANVADDWRVSVGINAGIRVVPGVFVEGDWEKHQEDLIMSQRFKLGLAFRFSLPDFEGQSYGDGLTSSNLYKIAEREKRALYEEHEESLNEGVVNGELAFFSLTSESTNILEGEAVTLTVGLSKAVSRDVVFNLSEGGEADYGADADWHLSVGGTDCATAEGTDCQVTISAGDTTAEVIVEVTKDKISNETPENFNVSVAVDSGSRGVVQERNQSTLPFSIPANNSLIIGSANQGVCRSGGRITVSVQSIEIKNSNTTIDVAPIDVVIKRIVSDRLRGNLTIEHTWKLNATDTEFSVDVTGMQISDRDSIEIDYDRVNEPAGWDFIFPILSRIQITDSC